MRTTKAYRGPFGKQEAEAVATSLGEAAAAKPEAGIITAIAKRRAGTRSYDVYIIERECEVCGGHGHGKITHDWVEATPKGEAKPANY